VRPFAQRLLFGVAIHLLRAEVPRANRAVELAQHDGVVREIEQLRLLPQRLVRALAFGGDFDFGLGDVDSLLRSLHRPYDPNDEHGIANE
jgi:hypothetical protein